MQFVPVGNMQPGLIHLIWQSFEMRPVPHVCCSSSSYHTLQSQRLSGDCPPAIGILEISLFAQAAADEEQVEALRRRVRDLETEQRLIQRELDSVSDAATRADSQLR